MLNKKRVRQMSSWGVPALYAAVAIAAGLTIPRLESGVLTRIRLSRQ